MNFLLVSTISLIGLVAFVSAETPKQLLDQLRSELRSELRSPPNRDRPETVERLAQLGSIAAQGLPPDAIEEVPLRQVAATLLQIRNLTQSPAVAKLAEQLEGQLAGLQQTREKEFLETSTKILSDAASAMLKADQAADLDPPMTAVMKVQRLAHSVSLHADSYGSRGEQARTLHELMTRWQDILLTINGAGPEWGDRERGDGNLDQFLTHLRDIVPRSAAMERLAELRNRTVSQDPKRKAIAAVDTRINAVLSRIRNLDELEPAIAEIEGVMRAQGMPLDGYDSYQPQALYTLRELGKVYALLKSGQAISLAPHADSLTNLGPGIRLPEFGAWKNQLIRFALPRVLGLGPERSAGEEETTLDYLRRMADQARKEKDWPLLTRVLETAATLNFAALANIADVAALRQVQAGMQLEQAGLRSSAVATYIGALKTGSLAVPADWIGERLEAIRTKWPDKYELGLQLAERPDPSRSSYGGRSALPPPSATAPSQLQVPAAPKPVEIKQADPEKLPAEVQPAKPAAGS